MGSSFLTKDKTGSVIKHSQTRIKQIEQFTLILAKRIQVQQAYADGLTKNAQMIRNQNIEKQDITIYSFTSFQQDCLNRAQQTKTFAQSLLQQILLPLKQSLISQQSNIKETDRQWKQAEKKLLQLSQNISKSKDKFMSYYDEIGETLMTNQICLSNQRMGYDKKVKIIAKRKELTDNLSDLENNYTRVVKDYNNYLIQYYKQIDQILQNLQKQERTRLAQQQDNIMRKLILQTSMFKNIEYDISKITKSLQNIKTIDVIERYTKNEATGKPRFSPVDTFLFKTALGETVLKITHKEIENKITIQNNPKVQSYILNKFKKVEQQQHQLIYLSKSRLLQFDQLFTLTDKLCFSSSSQQDYQVLRFLLKNQQNRLYLWLYLKQFQALQPSQLFSRLISIITQLLNACSHFRDIYVSRKLTNYIFILHHIPPLTKKKHYAYSTLITNKLYSSLDFWKASVFQSIQQNLRTNLKQSSDDIQNNLMKYVSLVYTQMATNCHKMITMGVPNNDVRIMMLGFCKMYEIPDREVKDLIRVIQNTGIKDVQEEKESGKRTVSFENTIQGFRGEGNPLKKVLQFEVQVGKKENKKQEVRKIDFGQKKEGK